MNDRMNAMMKTKKNTKVNPWLGLVLGATLLALTGCMAEKEPEPTAACTKCWTYVQPNVFEGTCTGCLTGGTAPKGLSLKIDQYTAIVTDGKMSKWDTSKKVVDNMGGTAALDASYLMHKIDSTTYPLFISDTGSTMPAGGAPLSAAEITMVADWIVGGALYDADPVP